MPDISAPGDNTLSTCPPAKSEYFVQASTSIGAPGVADVHVLHKYASQWSQKACDDEIREVFKNNATITKNDRAQSLCIGCQTGKWIDQRFQCLQDHF